MLSLCLLGFALSACSGAQHAQDPQQERLTKMLDEGRYDDVIHLIESDTSAQASFPDLLAMAYLGRGGFAPLSFAADVLAAQTPSAKLDPLVPGCDASAISSGASDLTAQIPVRCILKRLWAHLPDADSADFSKGRTLLRSAYPEAASAPTKYNALLAVVETASALSRVGAVVVRYAAINVNTSPASNDDVAFIFGQVNLTADEAQRALSRVTYGGSKVAGLLTGLNNEPLLKTNNLTVTWAEETGLPLIMQFTANTTPDAAGDPVSDTVKAALFQIVDRLVTSLAG